MLFKKENIERRDFPGSLFIWLDKFELNIYQYIYIQISQFLRRWKAQDQFYNLRNYEKILF